ncbi:MAG: Holliday junction resolvase RuvX [Cyanobacteriota bacterium]
MNRLLALDIGTKRIGVAVSDPLRMFSTGLPTINRKPENKAIEIIKAVCDEYNVEKIIVGLPINMNGSSGQQVEDVKEFVILLESEISAEIIFQDERLTSILAKRILIEQNISPSKNKGLVDKKAAALILQQYLDFINK